MTTRETEVDQPLEIEQSVKGVALRSSGSNLVVMTPAAAKETAVRLLQAAAKAEQSDNGSA